jgi:hypothetical protein
LRRSAASENAAKLIDPIHGGSSWPTANRFIFKWGRAGLTTLLSYAIALAMVRRLQAASVLVATVGIALCALQVGAGDANKLTREELKKRKEFLEAAAKQAHEEDLAKAAEDEKHGVFPSVGYPPTLVPFADWDFYYLTNQNVVWSPNPGQKLQPVRVPVGFVTDLASIPRAFWTLLPPQGRYAYGAIVHDYLYWTQARPRDEADQILKTAMEDMKVDPVTIATIYTAVRAAGQSAWDSNERLKANGERRLLKKFPDSATVSWAEWKKNPDVFADE